MAAGSPDLSLTGAASGRGGGGRGNYDQGGGFMDRPAPRGDSRDGRYDQRRPDDRQGGYGGFSGGRPRQDSGSGPPFEELREASPGEPISIANTQAQNGDSFGIK